jgi:hypothetical protein
MRLYRIAIAALMTFAAPAWAQTSQPTIGDSATDVYKILAKDMTSVTFPKGSDNLSKTDKDHLATLARETNQDATVDKLIVASWSDKEYPAQKDAKLDSADRRLADQRADAVKKALKDAGAKSVETFSMADHPSWLAKTFNTENAKLKGERKVKSTDDEIIADLGRQIRAKGGPSTAVIIVKHTADSMAH